MSDPKGPGFEPGPSMSTGAPRLVSPVSSLLAAMAEVVDILDQQTLLDNGEARKYFNECARRIFAATAQVPDYPPRAAYEIDGEVYKIEPPSARCGGSFAWLRQRPTGAWEMVGCICHHLPTGGTP